MSRYFYQQYAQYAQPATAGLADAYAVLWLRPGAPPAVVRAAYRALAARHHPDAGGDPGVMRRLNAAYAALDRAGATDSP